MIKTREVLYCKKCDVHWEIDRCFICRGEATPTTIEINKEDDLITVYEKLTEDQYKVMLSSAGDGPEDICSSIMTKAHILEILAKHDFIFNKITHIKDYDKGSTLRSCLGIGLLDAYQLGSPAVEVKGLFIFLKEF